MKCEKILDQKNTKTISNNYVNICFQSLLMISVLRPPHPHKEAHQYFVWLYSNYTCLEYILKVALKLSSTIIDRKKGYDYLLLYVHIISRATCNFIM